MFCRNWKSKLTSSERRRGWVFFFLYVLIFPRLSGWAQKILMEDADGLVPEANVVYYAILFIGVLLLFWSFLKHDFLDLLDWLPENLFGIIIGLVGVGVLYPLLKLLPFPVSDPVPGQYAGQFAVAPLPTVMLVLVLIPVVEEVLFRGLLFGSLRRYSRPAAYLISIVVYAFSCVWRYALDYGDPRYLLLTVLYLPVSAALTWCYDNGGSVWGTAVLHAAINGAALFFTLP
ncbi:MAG: type II CAAX endopeptidase family protein [Clostridiales bacterium]|nr:type II CAAX endopeptidase family protein [Clostridiales bacterium]